MTEGPEAVLGQGRGAAELIPGDGIVVHRKPLTIVISVADGAADIAPLATSLVDELMATGELVFGPVAEALQAFVVAYQPTGVAALLDVAPDPIAFLFDQARVAEVDEAHYGEGRAGWNTVFVAGPMVTLTAGTDSLDHERPPGWSRVIAGTVAGGGARTAITSVASPPGPALGQQPLEPDLGFVHDATAHQPP
ncbi:MAG: hypothetical protein ACR2QK_00065, partial [Acidimicrobiales bacterium]